MDISTSHGWLKERHIRLIFALTRLKAFNRFLMSFAHLSNSLWFCNVAIRQVTLLFLTLTFPSRQCSLHFSWCLGMFIYPRLSVYSFSTSSKPCCKVEDLLDLGLLLATSKAVFSKSTHRTFFSLKIIWNLYQVLCKWSNEVETDGSSLGESMGFLTDYMVTKQRNKGD